MASGGRDASCLLDGSGARVVPVWGGPYSFRAFDKAPRSYGFGGIGAASPEYGPSRPARSRGPGRGSARRRSAPRDGRLGHLGNGGGAGPPKGANAGPRPA